MKIVKQIPNSITCLNLLCGVLGILAAFESELIYCSYFILLACVLDFIDGFAARLLKASSPIGKDLDSLADMVSFGVLPAMIIYKLLTSHFTANSWPEHVVAVLPFIVTIMSAVRLANFNNDTRQTTSFIGVPTPANAILLASFPLILNTQTDSFIVDLAKQIIPNLYFLLGISFLMAYLLVSPIPLFALKFKSFAWTENSIKYIFLIASVLLLIFLKFIAIPLIIFLYVLLSLFTKE